MKIYTLKRTQQLPVSIQEAWDFFSSPRNLSRITPAHMNFRILYNSGGETMYAGQLIRYKINIFPWMATTWVTEITHVSHLKYFIDEQRSGPYAMWHHEHHFKETTNGVEMTDEINYSIPFGILGRLTNVLFVERMVSAIFEYRLEAIQNYFSRSNK